MRTVSGSEDIADSILAAIFYCHNIQSFDLVHETHLSPNKLISQKIKNSTRHICSWRNNFMY